MPVMVTSTAVLVRCQNPDDLAKRSAVALFLAGYTGSTRVSYTTGLRLFAEWCAGNRVRLLTVRRAHVELLARYTEAGGRMRSTVARRLSSLASLYRYCHLEGLLRRNPAANLRRPTVDHESRTLGVGSQRAWRPARSGRARNAAGSHVDPMLALNGLRISEALGADVTDLDVERGHRTLLMVRKGGKHVHSFITAALDAGVPLRDVQEAASHADPRTTMRYDHGRQSLDRHPTYVVAAFLAGAARNRRSARVEQESKAAITGRIASADSWCWKLAGWDRGRDSRRRAGLRKVRTVGSTSTRVFHTSVNRGRHASGVSGGTDFVDCDSAPSISCPLISPIQPGSKGGLPNFQERTGGVVFGASWCCCWRH
jgi:hypothetical protein